MKFNSLIKLHYILALSLIFLFACDQRKIHKKEDKLNNILQEQTLNIDTFSIFPPEISGCSCYFSNDSLEFKKSEYIYMNDYDKTSFIKINGLLIKFTQIERREISSHIIIAKFKSDSYVMTIELKDGIQNGDETWLKTGTIKLTNKKGGSITKTFYGECGC